MVLNVLMICRLYTLTSYVNPPTTPLFFTEEGHSANSGAVELAMILKGLAVISVLPAIFLV